MCTYWDLNRETLALIVSSLPFEQSGRHPSQHKIHSDQLFGDDIRGVI